MHSTRVSSLFDMTAHAPKTLQYVKETKTITQPAVNKHLVTLGCVKLPLTGRNLQQNQAQGGVSIFHN